jgi:cytochrome c-type biogenesis protein CcmH/NrfG
MQRKRSEAAAAYTRAIELDPKTSVAAAAQARLKALDTPPKPARRR